MKNLTTTKKASVAPATKQKPGAKPRPSGIRARTKLQAGYTINITGEGEWTP
jgi:hypothetical protein